MYVCSFVRLPFTRTFSIYRTRGQPMLLRFDFAECHTGKRRYNIKLWKMFTDCFNCLPVAALIDGKIFTMHGGLSPDLQSMEQIRRMKRPTDVPDTGAFSPSVRLSAHHLHFQL